MFIPISIIGFFVNIKGMAFLNFITALSIQCMGTLFRIITTIVQNFAIDCTFKNITSCFRHYKGISVRGFESNLEKLIYKYIGR